MNRCVKKNFEEYCKVWTDLYSSVNNEEKKKLAKLDDIINLLLDNIDDCK